MLKTTGKPELEVAYSWVTEPTPTGSSAPNVMACGCFGFVVLQVVERVNVVPFVVTVSQETCSEFEPIIVFPTYPYAVF